MPVSAGKSSAPAGWLPFPTSFKKTTHFPSPPEGEGGRRAPLSSLLPEGEGGRRPDEGSVKRFSKPGGYHDASRPRPLRPGQMSAFLRISEGCSRQCSFCVIPRLRGKLRSRSPEAVFKEARGLTDRGVRELAWMDYGEWYWPPIDTMECEHRGNRLVWEWFSSRGYVFRTERLRWKCWNVL